MPFATADELLEEASVQTGLTNFGSASFGGGLDAYVQSLGADAQLSDLGQFAVRATIVNALANRLKVVDWTARHPDVRNEKITAPLVVIGMFRAGTTLLSNLLDCDVANRSLLGWEAGDSAPPEGPADHRANERVEAARFGSDMLDQLNPAMRSVHHEEVDGPTECIAVMAQDFASLSWEAISNVPGYSAWLLASDQRSAYHYHRDVLRILQSGGVRGRWALKSPHHTLALDALTEVYPDARLVMLHRDPTVVSASVCSLIRTLSSTFSDADHTRYIASHWIEMLETMIERVDNFRTTRPDHAIVDVHYADLVTDPVGTVERIYTASGTQLSEVAAAAMRQYVADHPKGQFGSHGYNLRDFGLEEGAIRERFADYVRGHDVPVEYQAG